MGFSLVGGGNSNVKAAISAYQDLTGALHHSTTETRIWKIIHYPGTFSKLGGSIDNGSTGRSLRLRKNQANANNVLTFTDSVVDKQYDSTHSDTYAANDKLDLFFAASATALLYFTKMVYLPDSGLHVTFHDGPIYSTTGTTFGGLQGSDADTVEANVQCLMRTTGSVKYLAINVTVAGAHVATLRKNGVSGACTVSVPAGSTGVFEDLTHSDAFVSGDLLCIQQTSNSSGEASVSCHIEYTSPKNEVIGGFISGNVGPSTTDHFLPLVNAQNKFVTDSINNVTAQMQHGFRGIASRLRVHVITNGNGGSTTIAIRKNGADGNQFVTIATGQTGWFEDTTHTDTFEATDNVNYRMSSTGTGNMRLSQIMLTELPQDATTGSNLTVSSPSLPLVVLSQNSHEVATGIAASVPVIGTPTVSQRNVLSAPLVAVSSPELVAPMLFQDHKPTASALATSSPVIRTATLVGTLIDDPGMSLTVSSPVPGMPTAAIHIAAVSSSFVNGHPAFTAPILNPPYVPVGLLDSSPVVGVPVLQENSHFFIEEVGPRGLVITKPTMALVLAANGLVVGRPALGSSKVKHFPKFVRIPVPQNDGVLYDPTLDMWPDLRYGRVVLMPSRVGVDRRSGKVLVGWAHVVQSMQTIFATRYHERVLRRWVGSFVPHLLGDNATQRVITRFYWAIATSIDLYEPNYRIKRVRVGTRSDGTLLTSTAELQSGNITTQMEGIYRPRAHLGDDTPETRRQIGLVGRGNDVWDKA